MTKVLEAKYELEDITIRKVNLSFIKNSFMLISN